MIYRFAPFDLDTARYELRRDGEPCRVEPQVFDILKFLIDKRERVVGKEELLDNVWPGKVVTESALTTRLKAARRTLGDSGRQQKYIRTAHGRGYRFVAAVTVVEPDHEPVLVAPGVPAAAARTTAPVAAPVGRAGELGRLQSCFEQAAASTRQFVFVTGDAGFGKTTLVEAFIAALDADVSVARGQCLEHHGAGESYMPVLDALARLRRAYPAVTESIAQYAPTWAMQLPGLATGDALARLHERTVGASHERMLREASDLLDVIAGESPLVLVIEDLQWSDQATVQLIGWLARRTDPARLMLIGTCRSTEMKASGHTLLRVVQELQLRDLATEIALTMLGAAAVADYVDARFAGIARRDELAARLYQRSDGNPLFLGSLVDEWQSRGVVANEDGKWAASAALNELTRAVPANLRGLIEQQRAVLSENDRRLLDTASVVGKRFSVALLARVMGDDIGIIEERLADLARFGHFVDAAGGEDVDSGGETETFVFRHDIFQEVIYQRLQASTRTRLHDLVGRALEAAYGDEAPAHAAELAEHFVRARVPDAAMRFLCAAADNASARNAYPDAVAHLERARELLQRSPDLEDAAQWELRVCSMLAPALIMTRGWGAPEAAALFVRARELCERLVDDERLSSVLYALAVMHEQRGEYRQSQQLLEERLALTRSIGQGQGVETHELMACSLYHQGRFRESLEHAERGLGAYDARKHNPAMAEFGEDPGVSCHCWAALNAWFLGDEQGTIAHAAQALALASEAGHDYSLGMCLAQRASLFQLQDKVSEVRDTAEAVIEQSVARGFRYWESAGRVFLGWAKAMQGDAHGGIEQLVTGLEGHSATGVCMDRPYYLALYAQALVEAGRLEQALEVLAQAGSFIDADRHFFYESEILLCRAHILLRLDRRANQAEVRALHSAALQRARSLRAPPLIERAERAAGNVV